MRSLAIVACLVSPLALGMTASAGDEDPVRRVISSDAQPDRQINASVVDVNNSCAHYQALGFEASADCDTCNLVVMTREGVRITLWPDPAGSGVSPRHFDVTVTSEVDVDTLYDTGAEFTPSAERPGCQTVTDLDGYAVDVCAQRPTS